MTDAGKLEADRLAVEQKAKDDAAAAELANLKAIGAVDDDGVPWKNRAKEAERKREIMEQEHIELQVELQAKIDALKNPAPPIEEEDAWTKQQREITRQELEKFETRTKKDKEALGIMKSILNDIEARRPRIKKYRAEIEARLSALSPNLQSNPNSVALMVNAVLGEHDEDVVPALPASGESGRRLVQVNGEAASGSEVLTPTPGAGSSTKIELTSEEEKYAVRNNLFDKGFTDAEIREQYKKRQDKLKTREKK